MNPITPVKKPVKVQNNVEKKKAKSNIPSPALRNALYEKSRENDSFEPNSSLIIMSESSLPSNDITGGKAQSFNLKKVIMPLAGATIGLFGAVAASSFALRHINAGKIKKSLDNGNLFQLILNPKNREQAAEALKKLKMPENLPDLSTNVNIKQEPQFATYMLLREPNSRRLLGTFGVFAMSAVTLISKNFIDGVKEIWIKKKESDIQRDLQENLINTETKVFSGKLQIERNLLSKTANYFSNILNKEPENSSIYKLSNTFKSICNFKGLNKNNDVKNENNNDNLLLAGVLGLTALSGVLFGKVTYKNIMQIVKDSNEYTTRITEEAIKYIEKIVADKDMSKLEALEDLFTLIYFKSDIAKEKLVQMGVPDEKMKEIIARIERKSKSIYTEPPKEYAGITSKIQYYCYLDDDRGHLYNWIMNPENPFTKYIFLAFSALSAIGYSAEQVVDAVKKVAVAKENSNTEYGLQSRLVEVELKNYESKKSAAISPLLEEFDKRLADGASSQELKNLADNILMEIKTGPPFVYG